ncbi:HAMP domain-containing protein [Inquilinus sp. KBS0705]|nr:HAMP domain-containing protein [Inquilinus sp. KBS0705]
MKLSSQILLGFLIAISIDLIDSYVNYMLTLKVKTNMDFVNSSETIIRNLSTLNKEIINMESALRGYLLTDDDQFLVAYNNGLHTIPLLVKQEERLIRPVSSQRLKLDSIVKLHGAWLNYANRLINAKRNSTTTASTQYYKALFDEQFRKGVGRSYNEMIAKIFRSFGQYEYNVREERQKKLAASIKRTETSSLFFSLLLIILGASLAIYIVKKISFRISSMVKLAENISQGKFTTVIDDKKDELSSLSHSLNTMSETLSRNITELEKKNNELDQFAYVVSHDLKAPIRGINNVVQWINEDLTQEVSFKMRKYLDIIPERLGRMENLIDGLLEYARVSREKQTKEEVDVAKMINEIAEEIVPMKFRLTVKNLPKLWTERLLLQQVFSNLINNAVKYQIDGNGKINISCIENEFNYEFTVSDNGPGIEQAYHQKIFVIFQTLRDKHDKESTGIGLAIVKKIIDEKNCTIRVKSSAGEGADFIFTWPKN